MTIAPRDGGRSKILRTKCLNARSRGGVEIPCQAEYSRRGHPRLAIAFRSPEPHARDMKLTNLRPSRSITSYAGVQKYIGNRIRNSRWQLRSSRVRSLQYLDLGCGPNTHENFINLEYRWSPKIDLCWDVSQGIPFPDRSLRGVFTEHCLEHFPLSVAEKVIREVYRVLVPGGRVRIIVPDAEIYLTRYTDRIRQLSDALLPFEQECAHSGIAEPILA